MSKEYKLRLVEQERECLESKINRLVKLIGEIPIASKKLLPYGWRKAAKGRTVWRIVEEVISQNLEYYSNELGFIDICAPESEVGVYDFEFQITRNVKSFVNIKSAVIDAKPNKDDISKSLGLIDFISNNIDKNLYIATFFIDFTDDMTVDIQKCVVFPTAWIPDIYVNPSNNGNLQSKDYKYIETAVKRTNEEFLELLKREQDVASLGGITEVKKQIENLVERGLSAEEIAKKIPLHIDKIHEIIG